MPERVIRQSRNCERCGQEFLIGGRSGRRWRRFCSKRCAMIGQKRGLGSMSKNCAPTLHPTVFDIAWAAGIYEGEGSCTRDTTERAHVGQKHHWLCDRL